MPTRSPSNKPFSQKSTKMRNVSGDEMKNCTASGHLQQYHAKPPLADRVLNTPEPTENVSQCLPQHQTGTVYGNPTLAKIQAKVSMAS